MTGRAVVAFIPGNNTFFVVPTVCPMTSVSPCKVVSAFSFFDAIVVISLVICSDEVASLLSPKTAFSAAGVLMFSPNSAFSPSGVDFAISVDIFVLVVSIGSEIQKKKNHKF